MEDSTLVTTNIAEVLKKITGKETFIAIGELHNSRSAIKFILDNINLLAPSDGRKTHLLTEFLPTDLHLIPNMQQNKNFYPLAKKKLGEKRKTLETDVGQRESSRSNPEETYTIENLYQTLFGKDIAIHSIEYQDDGNAALYYRLQAGDPKAYAQRTNQINDRGVERATAILKKDPTARILIFAGMGHTSDSVFRKYNKETDAFIPEEELRLVGISRRLKDQNYPGVNISVHDLDLCTDKEHLRNIHTRVPFFTKYEIGDACLTWDNPDFLLFLDTPPHPKALKKITKGYESIFLPGPHNINIVKNEGGRTQLLAAVPPAPQNDAAKKKKKKKKKKKPAVASSPAADSVSEILAAESQTNDTAAFISYPGKMFDNSEPSHVKVVSEPTAVGKKEEITSPVKSPSLDRTSK
ncbi:MAG: hypothetical protein SFW07_03840 [Gammaproteobacteria bacterium]|nr:hypothetical protein [Gammaproteobacteria bacterium]